MTDTNINNTNLDKIEDASLKRVQEMGLLDNLAPEERFDQYTREAVEKLHVPISTLTILDGKNEHYKSCQGLNETESPRAISFCAHALLSKDLFIISDCSKDERFANNPMVVGSPFIRFYAGMAIYDHKSGIPVAVFCIKDRVPREFDATEIATFLEIVGKVEKEINK
ncbi:MAG: GAF domain-containing protein [bacterium]